MKNMVFSPPQAKNRPESGVSEHRVSELASPPPLSGQIGDADPLYDLDHPYPDGTPYNWRTERDRLDVPEWWAGTLIQ